MNNLIKMVCIEAKRKGINIDEKTPVAHCDVEYNNLRIFLNTKPQIYNIICLPHNGGKTDALSVK